VNGYEPNTGQRYFCQTKDKIEGPFDLIELAGLLRESAIDGDTPIREETSEVWHSLREHPEYGSLQEIPIEIIARHVLGKERAQASRSSSQKTSFSTVWIGVGFAVIGLALAMAWPRPAPQPVVPTVAPSVIDAPGDWFETKGDHFSIRCPIALELVKRSSSGVDSYRGYDQGKVFGVEIQYAPEYSEKECQQQIAEMQRSFPQVFFVPFFSEKLSMSEGGGVQGDPDVDKPVSDVSGDGYRGREYACEVSSYSEYEKGRGRFVYGKGSIVMLYVIAKRHQFDSLNMERFLKSLQLR